MAETLSAPEVLECYFDRSFDLHLPSMSLRWGRSRAANERLWYLPEGICLSGSPPERFGLHVERRDADAYSVRLLCNQTSLSWSSLTRAQLMTSALAPLLAAMGTDLWYLLDQPLQTEDTEPRKAA